VSTLVSFIEIKGKIVKGVFEKRRTRFSALVKVEDKTVEAFLPNPGRLQEILTSGTKVVLREALKRKARKTVYDLIGVFHKGQKLSVDSRVPNRLVLEALKNRDIRELSEYHVIKPEYTYGRARFDFLLSGNQKPCLLEVKSCTLVKNGTALFPDAKTERGVRHVKELIKAGNEGYRACILFLIQRTDAYKFSPNDDVDPEFGRILRHAVLNGVEVCAYSSQFIGNKIELGEKVKVKL